MVTNFQLLRHRIDDALSNDIHEIISKDQLVNSIDKYLRSFRSWLKTIKIYIDRDEEPDAKKNGKLLKDCLFIEKKLYEDVKFNIDDISSTLIIFYHILIEEGDKEGKKLKHICTKSIESDIDLIYGLNIFSSLAKFHYNLFDFILNNYREYIISYPVEEEMEEFCKKFSDHKLNEKITAMKRTDELTKNELMDIFYKVFNYSIEEIKVFCTNFEEFKSIYVKAPQNSSLATYAYNFVLEIDGNSNLRNIFLDHVKQVKPDLIPIKDKQLFDNTPPSGFEEIIRKLDEQTEVLINRIDDNKEIIIQEINTKFSQEEMYTILEEIKSNVSDIKNKKFTALIERIEKSSDPISTKLQLSIPIIPAILKIKHEISLDSPLRKFAKFTRKYV